MPCMRWPVVSTHNARLQDDTQKMGDVGGEGELEGGVCVGGSAFGAVNGRERER